MNSQSATRKKNHPRRNSSFSGLSASHRVSLEQVEKLPKRASAPKLGRSKGATLAVSGQSIAVKNVRHSAPTTSTPKRSAVADTQTQNRRIPIPKAPRGDVTVGGHARSKTATGQPKKAAPLGLRDVTNTRSLQIANAKKINRSNAIKESGTIKRPAKPAPVPLPVAVDMETSSSAYDSDSSDSSSAGDWHSEYEAFEKQSPASTGPKKAKGPEVFALRTPRATHAELQKKFEGKLDKLEAAVTSGDAKAIRHARTKARDLADLIKAFEEVALPRLEDERCGYDQWLSSTQDDAKAKELKAKLDDIAQTQVQILRARAYRESVLKTTLAPENASVRYKRPKLNWPSINLTLEKLSSPLKPNATPALRSALLALVAAVPDLDLQAALLALVSRFSRACQSERTELPVLLKLIAQSKSDPGQAKLLALVKAGVTLDMGSYPTAEDLALQAPLEHINVLLQLIEAEPQGAQLYAEIMEDHARTMKPESRVLPKVIRNRTRKEPDQRRLVSLQNFLAQYSAQGVMLAMNDAAGSVGTRHAGPVLEVIEREIAREELLPLVKEELRLRAQMQFDDEQ